MDSSCQILNDREKGTTFLLKLYHAVRGKTPYASTEVVGTLAKLLECVTGAIKAHDKIPPLKEGPLKWLWINEMTRHDAILVSAFDQLDKLNKCVRGHKVLDDNSMALAKVLTTGQVPPVWAGEDKTLFSLTVGNFIRVVNERTGFYQVPN